MIKHLKRLSALLVALAIFFTAIPASAFYTDEEDVTLNEVQETDSSSAENVDMSFELLILPQYESGTTYSFTYDGFARNVATKVGNRTLSSYTYNAKGLPQTMTYGNGVTVSYGYDALNRQTSFSVNDVLKYQYRYDGYSRLSELIDLSLNRKTRYEYDILGRPTSEKVVYSLTNSLLSKLNLRYDDSKNRLAGYDVNIGGITNSTDYVYGGNSVAPDLISGVKLNGTQKISYTYDGLNRLSVRNLNNFLTEYTYLQGATNTSTTTLVGSMKNGDDTLSYTYDELGNITSISKNGTVIESYTYDDLNQLKTVTRGTDTYTYNYDNGGNILSVTKNGTTIKSYTYGDTEWKDLLTAYNGNAITYDNIGNPLTYYNGSTFTWSDGRKLTGVTKGTDNISYTYDSNGLRASKTVNGVKTEYYWLDGTLYAEKTGSQYIYYHYDDNGIAYGFTVVNGNTTTDYYYIHNLQGDVIGIVDSTGTTVVEYTYDEWGKILATTGSLATTIGTLNPFRYRGYYYDAETEFYYCRARYYDAEICRWISADGYVSTGQCIISFNMFAYCNNNPVNSLDLTGQKSELLPAIWEEIKQRLMGLSPVYVGAGTSTLADGPLPIVDAVAIGTVALITLASVGVGVAEGIRQYSHSKDSEKEKEKAKPKVVPLPRDPNSSVVFPVNPNDFNPNGLIKTVRSGTKNGKLISWMDPITNIEVFRWDENPNYSNGAHYHIHGLGHYVPGIDRVPKLYADIYFPDKH